MCKPRLRALLIPLFLMEPLSSLPFSTGRPSKNRHRHLPGRTDFSMVTPSPEIFWGTPTLPHLGVREGAQALPMEPRPSEPTVPTSVHSCQWIRTETFWETAHFK